MITNGNYGAIYYINRFQVYVALFEKETPYLTCLNLTLDEIPVYLSTSNASGTLLVSSSNHVYLYAIDKTYNAFPDLPLLIAKKFCCSPIHNVLWIDNFEESDVAVMLPSKLGFLTLHLDGSCSVWYIKGDSLCKFVATIPCFKSLNSILQGATLFFNNGRIQLMCIAGGLMPCIITYDLHISFANQTISFDRERIICPSQALPPLAPQAHFQLKVVHLPKDGKQVFISNSPIPQFSFDSPISAKTEYQMITLSIKVNTFPFPLSALSVTEANPTFAEKTFDIVSCYRFSNVVMTSHFILCNDIFDQGFIILGWSDGSIDIRRLVELDKVIVKLRDSQVSRENSDVYIEISPNAAVSMCTSNNGFTLYVTTREGEVTLVDLMEFVNLIIPHSDSQDPLIQILVNCIYERSEYSDILKFLFRKGIFSSHNLKEKLNYFLLEYQSKLLSTHFWIEDGLSNIDISSLVHVLGVIFDIYRNYIEGYELQASVLLSTIHIISIRNGIIQNSKNAANLQIFLDNLVASPPNTLEEISLIEELEFGPVLPFLGSISWFLNLMNIVFADCIYLSKMVVIEHSSQLKMLDPFPSFSSLIVSNTIRRWIFDLLFLMHLYKKFLEKNKDPHLANLTSIMNSSGTFFLSNFYKIIHSLEIKKNTIMASKSLSRDEFRLLNSHIILTSHYHNEHFTSNIKEYLTELQQTLLDVVSNEKSNLSEIPFSNSFLFPIYRSLISPKLRESRIQGNCGGTVGSEVMLEHVNLSEVEEACLMDNKKRKCNMKHLKSECDVIRKTRMALKNTVRQCRRCHFYSELSASPVIKGVTLTPHNSQHAKENWYQQAPFYNYFYHHCICGGPWRVVGICPDVSLSK